jgi:hypothetical protein
LGFEERKCLPHAHERSHAVAFEGVGERVVGAGSNDSIAGGVDAMGDADEHEMGNTDGMAHRKGERQAGAEGITHQSHGLRRKHAGSEGIDNGDEVTRRQPRR